MLGDYLRPIVIGLVATIASAALGRAFSRWLPDSAGGKTQAELLHEHRRTIWAANASTLVGLAVGLLMYKLLGFSVHDFRPLGLAAGIALAAPMIVPHLMAVWSGKNSAEAVAAYALDQKLPAAILYGIATFGVVALLVTLLAFGRS